MYRGEVSFTMTNEHLYCCIVALVLLCIKRYIRHKEFKDTMVFKRSEIILRSTIIIKSAIDILTFKLRRTVSLSAALPCHKVNLAPVVTEGMRWPFLSPWSLGISLDELSMILTY